MGSSNEHRACPHQGVKEAKAAPPPTPTPQLQEGTAGAAVWEALPFLMGAALSRGSLWPQPCIRSNCLGEHRLPWGWWGLAGEARPLSLPLGFEAFL